LASNDFYQINQRSKSGRVLIVNRKEVKKRFGIKAGARVETPKGKAVGMSERKI
jgi:hypothetical protein